MRQYQISKGSGFTNITIWAYRLGEVELEARKLGLKNVTIKVIK